MPEVLKVPVRFVLYVYWALRHVVDRLVSKQYKHIVICGYPRGGTSLLYNMLSVSLDGFSFDEFETRVLERLHRYGNYATKMPMDVFDLGKVDRLNKFGKDICAIVVMRDVRDVLTSRHPNVPDEYFIGYDHSWWPKNKDFTEWEYTAPGIGALHDAMEVSGSIQGIRLFKIKYEDLVADVDGAQKRLEAFLGVKFSRQIKDFYKDSSRMAYRYEGKYKAKDESLVMEDKSLVTSRAGKWRSEQYRERIFEQFTKHPALFDVLIKDGYEKDNLWFDVYRK